MFICYCPKNNFAWHVSFQQACPLICSLLRIAIHARFQDWHPPLLNRESNQELCSKRVTSLQRIVKVSSTVDTDVHARMIPWKKKLLRGWSLSSVASSALRPLPKCCMCQWSHLWLLPALIKSARIAKVPTDFGQPHQAKMRRLLRSKEIWKLRWLMESVMSPRKGTTHKSPSARCKLSRALRSRTRRK